MKTIDEHVIYVEHVVCLWNIYGLMEHCMCLCGTCSDIIYMYIPSMLYWSKWWVHWNLGNQGTPPSIYIYLKCWKLELEYNLDHILSKALKVVLLLKLSAPISHINMTFFGGWKFKTKKWCLTPEKDSKKRKCENRWSIQIVDCNGPVRVCCFPKKMLGQMDQQLTSTGFFVRVKHGPSMKIN